uniref:Uncharacterized protein n=1 Tax=Arcella intermedia TaxID=1963864 RepID=A0A6B2L656_9EUKA
MQEADNAFNGDHSVTPEETPAKSVQRPQTEGRKGKSKSKFKENKSQTEKKKRREETESTKKSKKPRVSPYFSGQTANTEEEGTDQSSDHDRKSKKIKKSEKKEEVESEVMVVKKKPASEDSTRKSTSKSTENIREKISEPEKVKSQTKSTPLEIKPKHLKKLEENETTSKKSKEEVELKKTKSIEKSKSNENLDTRKPLEKRNSEPSLLDKKLSQSAEKIAKPPSVIKTKEKPEKVNRSTPELETFPSAGTKEKAPEIEKSTSGTKLNFSDSEIENPESNKRKRLEITPKTDTNFAEENSRKRNRDQQNSENNERASKRQRSFSDLPQNHPLYDHSTVLTSLLASIEDSFLSSLEKQKDYFHSLLNKTLQEQQQQLTNNLTSGK